MSQNNAGGPRRGPGGPMGGGPHGGMSGEKAKDFKGTLAKLVAYLGRYRVPILIVWLFAIAATILSTFGPKVLGNATDVLFTGLMGQLTGTGSGIDFGEIGRIILLLLGLYVVSAILSYAQGFIMSKITMKTTHQLRKDLDAKIHRLPLSYFDKTTHGEVLSRIVSDVDTVNQTLNQSMTQMISSAVQLVTTLVLMLTISWRLTLVALLIVPLSMVAVMTVVKKSQKYFARQQQSLGSVNGHVEEMYGAHVLVTAFNGQDSSAQTFGKHNDELYKSAWKANFLSGLMMPITNIIGNFGYVAVCILGGTFAANGQMTIGGIQSFIQYVRQFMQPISQVASITNVLQQTAAAAERVFAFLEEPEEVEDNDRSLSVYRGGERQSHSVEVEGNVGFRHVSFGYNPQNLIVHDFTAQVQKGQKIAIVGPTGAGKTTIVKLLMRFYDVNAGEINIDGHDIRLFKRNELRSLLGMVLQETWLFNGSIADNIRYGKLDATDEEVKRAAKAAQVDHFVRTLPDGYKMVLNEEASNISQGQKQLLTIARAILADPEILILDEATSSVDTRTEILIQKAMDNLMKGRTSFIIAHRLSTIRNADLILVMKDGDIVEQGAHEALLAKGGFYAELYNSQFDAVG